MRIMFTGSRDWTDREVVRTCLDRLPRDSLIIEGAARGLDQIVYEVAGELGFLYRIRFPAQWHRLGKKAGAIRNRLMLDTARPELVIAFPLPQSIGTYDAMREAMKRGVSVIDWAH